MRRRARDPQFAGRTLHSIYFGGGTPSLLEPAQVGRLIEEARALFPAQSDLEISLESNPDGAQTAHLAALRSAGVNRFTIGWQSLRDAHLRALTRTHSAADNLRAYAGARDAGFENVAVDLIFGIPGQTAADWLDELREVAALVPDHVSAYELTFEEGTKLTRRMRAGKITPPDDGVRAEMFEATDEILGSAGIRRYEISNFARPGLECRHNLEGWRGGDLLGLGASGASHVRNARWTNIADLDEYLRRVREGEDIVSETERLDDATWAAEDLYLGLRTVQGIAAESRLQSVGEPARSRLLASIERAIGEGYLDRDHHCVFFTRRGRLFADLVFEDLLTGTCPAENHSSTS
ncbi:MAG TPA: radical SAM family heme chaperone HemW, partial [bacterium]|nr:radical SAM family heme chaperone HemW [bacterium]